ncbi:hypothetical protein ANCCAN_00031 [Ancylostoma caninum]|uniref:DUF5641 domain-containing protein n=1 Tax=Ancylostoma caninum TaxID=29170 RepID=A0A368HCW4_ANCCA|nr:hypothetical protein ANCCAN_00031 [Ancylostoma caninum]
MVGTVKRSLQRTIGRRKLTEELFHTTLCEIESVVNFRPLMTIDDQDSPCEFLRPIDFVYMELSSQKAANEAMSERERLTKKFWTIWKHEYLIELRNRRL